MNRTIPLQLFLLVLALGFLAGPQVIEALQRLPIKGGEASVLAADAGASATIIKKNDPAKVRPAPDPFRDLSLEAKSVYVWDIKARRKLYAQNSDLKLPMASVTKLMTALVASETLPKETRVVISARDLSEEGDTGLSVGEAWSLERLLAFTLVVSSNDGAHAIAVAGGKQLQRDTGASTTPPFDLFIGGMNQKARAIGLLNTTFRNASGLDVANGESGGYGTARDIAMLFEYVFRKHPDLLLPTTSGEIELRSESGLIHRTTNTNQDVLHIPGIIGSKTGFTDMAGGNLAVIVDIGIDHPIVIVVLGSTREGRFVDVEKLIEASVHAITGSLPS